MRKVLFIAWANIRKHKSASASLFVIIMIVSALLTTGLSVMFGASRDFMASVDRLNSPHSVLMLGREAYNPSFEDVIKDDPRVSHYDISEAVILSSPHVNYGGEAEIFGVCLLDLDRERAVSAPKISSEDLSIPRASAVYLPILAESYGQRIGDTFTITYRNKPIDLTVAGFFETNELSLINMGFLRFFVPEECFEELSLQYGGSVWIAARFWDMNDSVQFNTDFAEKVNVDLSEFVFEIDSVLVIAPAYAVMMVSSIILIFALILAFVSLLVVRFRVANSIENSMHEIGVLKASGYTSAQVSNSYLMEYGLIALPAALLGTLLPIPLFPAIRQIFASMTGASWTLGVDVAAAGVSVLFIVAVLLLMVNGSCRKIKRLPPVTALRGGIATISFRRNFFALNRGAGSVHTRLGLKNMLAYSKSYAMIALVIAGISLAATFMAAVSQNFMGDQAIFAKMSGYEISDVSLTTASHVDAEALAAQIERMPDVRKTFMFDTTQFSVDGFSIMGHISNDFERMETLNAHDGRLPRYDNEIAFPKLFAKEIGKDIGDSVKVKAGGVSQDFIITGFYSTFVNTGRIASVTLDGYQRLQPNYRRNTININLNEGVGFEEFSEQIAQEFGVLNRYRQDEDGAFAAAKARAEEKISTYLELYDVDNVEYAVIYEGEIILSGSSAAYQIEKVTDYREFMKASIDTYGNVFYIVTFVIMVVSLIIIVLILGMTVRSIVTKRHRELGTMKATGFTTKQLARQLAISFMPMTLVGIVVGCMVGSVLVNPLMGVMLGASGVANPSLEINPLVVALVGVLLLVVTYVAANISAKRIKHISVYELLSE